MEFELDKLVRENIRELLPYSSARKEFNEAAEVWLDANENSFGSPLPNDYNRYPDPLQTSIKEKLSGSLGVHSEEIFVGNGSDEAIDLLFRIFCRPGVDNVLICPPTYGMYEVSANINDVAVKRVDLTSEFQLDANSLKNAVDENTKLIFICSPNNPTGNLMDREAILDIVKAFHGVVVVDEAYIHFSGALSLVAEIGMLPNLVVLQTFSKAWGLAGLRIGLAFANKQIVDLFNKIKPPYNVGQIAQEMILDALENEAAMTETVAAIISEREKVNAALKTFPFVLAIYASDANFLLAKTIDADDIYQFLLREKIVVRNRGNIQLCEGCIRITIGTTDENAKFITALENYEKSLVY